MDRNRARGDHRDDLAARVGRWSVAAAVAILFWKIGGVSSARYGTPSWKPWTWRPGPIFRDTTTNGGDTGAHVWTPDFLRRVLLPSHHATGWSKDWYAGFPVLRFYFPLPMWVITSLGLIVPPNIAFKLVTVAGVMSLPFAAMSLARAAELDQAMVHLFGLASVVFLFDPHYDILGGNVLSTMAGEFSFSIGLTLAVWFLATLLRMIRQSAPRWIPALLLALTVLCHALPAMFAAIAAVILLVAMAPTSRHGVRRQLIDATSVAGVAASVSAFWTVPFAAGQAYTNNMGWERATDFLGAMFPPAAKVPTSGAATMGAVIVLAVLGSVHQLARLSAALRSHRSPDAPTRTAVALVAMAGVASLLFRFPGQDRVLNERSLPFYFLCAVWLACFGLQALGAMFGRIIRARSDRFSGDSNRRRLVAVALASVTVSCWWSVGSTLSMLPGFVPVPKLDAHGIGLQRADALEDLNPAQDWAFYNYSGYQSMVTWPEQQQLVQAMTVAGATYGCGRAMWEYEDELERYGSQMSLMLLPRWTHGCIGSMEGLYFESSPTVPFHFLNASLLSARPDNPQAALPYSGLDVAEGVRHLQQWGVRYYLALSPAAQAQARTVAALRRIASSPYRRECTDEERSSNACPTTWEIYLVEGSQLVEGLRTQPAVVTGIGPGQTQGWLDVAIAHYQSTTPVTVPLVASGPASWQRVAARVGARRSRQPVGQGVDIGSATSTPLPPVAVSDIIETDGEVRFRVSRTGVPVVVKESYFPNWTAHGAHGPFRMAPNLMVVIPDSPDVVLRFEQKPADRLGMILSALGIVALLLLARADRRQARRKRVQTRRTSGGGSFVRSTS